jgi:hypothetical protein
MKIQAFVISCDKFLYACIIEIASSQLNQSVTVFFTSLLLPMHVLSKICSMCEQVNHFELGPDCREDGNKMAQFVDLHKCYSQMVFTTLILMCVCVCVCVRVHELQRERVYTCICTAFLLAILLRFLNSGKQWFFWVCSILLMVCQMCLA